MERPGAWALTEERAQDEADLPFVRMTQSEFDAEKQRAKRDRRFVNWDAWRNWVERVDLKRRTAARKSAPPPAPRPRTELETLYEHYYEALEVMGPLMANAAPFRYSAREFLALVALRTGDNDLARAEFQKLSQEAGTPQGLRRRAVDILDTIGAPANSSSAATATKAKQ
jgi:hypothetical protein